MTHTLKQGGSGCAAENRLGRDQNRRGQPSDEGPAVNPEERTGVRVGKIETWLDV